MSPLLDLVEQQRQGVELGRLRAGVAVKKDGKSFPSKLDAWRLTSRRRDVIEHAAALWGGQPREWVDHPGEFEVLTDATELPVMIPPGQPLTQDYEMWTAGGCQRRCDGVTERLSGDPCLCPADRGDRADLASLNPPRACKPTTRLRVVLPDLPGVGVWRLDSHGIYAALELAGTAELLHTASTRGVLLAASLRLEQRTGVKRPGKPANKFAVPVLDVHASTRQLMTGEGLEALPPQPTAVAAIGAPDAPAIASGEPDVDPEVLFGETS